MIEFCRTNQIGLMLFLQGVCIAIAFLTVFMRYLSKTRRLIIILLELNAAACLAASRFYYAYKDMTDPTLWPWVRSAKFFDYLFVITILACFNFYLRDLLKNEGELKKAPASLYVADGLVVAGIITLFVSQYTDLYYYWDANNTYIHGKFYFLTFVTPMLTMLIQLVVIIRNFNRLSKGIRIPLLLFIIIPIVMTVIQYATQGVAAAVISTVGMAIVLYIFSIQEMNKSIAKAHRMEIEMMATYQKELEETVAQRTHELKVANDKAEHLLLNILPEKIARELADNPEKTISKRYPNATVLFTDIVGFTKMSSSMSPEETVTMLNMMTTAFDERARREGVEKIKTIGDAYMAAAGLTEDDSDDGAEKMIKFARGIMIDVREVSRTLGIPIQIRIGINTGELVAGVIGKSKFIYDVWGDTVNIASRMESTGTPMTIHVSEATYELIKDRYSYKEKAQVEVKGKGMMNGYLL